MLPPCFAKNRFIKDPLHYAELGESLRVRLLPFKPRQLKLVSLQLKPGSVQLKPGTLQLKTGFLPLKPGPFCCVIRFGVLR